MGKGHRSGEQSRGLGSSWEGLLSAASQGLVWMAEICDLLSPRTYCSASDNHLPGARWGVPRWGGPSTEELRLRRSLPTRHPGAHVPSGWERQGDECGIVRVESP